MLGKLSFKIFILFNLFTLYSPVIFAVQDFKCYVQLSNQTATIENQFANNTEQAKQKIKKRWIKNKANITSIIDIQECVQIQKNFSTFEAHTLDMITPQ